MPDVVDPLLLVQLRHRLGPEPLADLCGHLQQHRHQHTAGLALPRQLLPRLPHDLLGHRTAVVALHNDGVGPQVERELAGP